MRLLKTFIESFLQEEITTQKPQQVKPMKKPEKKFRLVGKIFFEDFTNMDETGMATRLHYDADDTSRFSGIINVNEKLSKTAADKAINLYEMNKDIIGFEREQDEKTSELIYKSFIELNPMARYFSIQNCIGYIFIIIPQGKTKRVIELSTGFSYEEFKNYYNGMVNDDLKLPTKIKDAVVNELCLRSRATSDLRLEPLN